MSHVRNKLKILKKELSDSSDEAFFSKQNLMNVVDWLLEDTKLDEKENMKLQEAIQKQIPVEPKLYMNEKCPIFIEFADGHGESRMQYKHLWHCQRCGGVVGERKILYQGRVHDQKRKVYCDRCGQKMEWRTTWKENLN